jgi:hypothetical protein
MLVIGTMKIANVETCLEQLHNSICVAIKPMAAAEEESELLIRACNRLVGNVRHSERADSKGRPGGKKKMKREKPLRQTANFLVFLTLASSFLSSVSACHACLHKPMLYAATSHESQSRHYSVTRSVRPRKRRRRRSFEEKQTTGEINYPSFPVRCLRLWLCCLLSVCLGVSNSRCSSAVSQ